ncbi:MAG TPA: CHAT domain-containing protein, partial [Ktedonobacteraceae bacterium]|nr:CHAT domain-containing protein [Ktedonobacteraceae bacterium]
MDNLHCLFTLSLEEGKQHLRQLSLEGEQTVAASAWLEEEALNHLYAPLTSLKLAELLMFLGEDTHNSISYALGLKARGDALVQIGHYKAAIKSLDEAGALFLQQRDEENWARSRISWIVACAWLGDIEEALREAEQARAVFSHLDKPSWVCTIDNNIAVIYGQAGRYQEAHTLYERMRATYLTLVGQDSTSVLHNAALVDLNQSINLAWLGDFEQAYFLQCRARDRLRELAETNLELIAEINIADFDYLQGYYGSALRRYYYVLDTLQASADVEPLKIAKLKLVIANCLIKLNRAQEARQLAGEAVTLCQQFDTSLNTVLALITYATALVGCGQGGQAIDRLTEAEGVALHGNFEHQIVAIRLQKAELLQERGEVVSAYEQAHLIRQTCINRGLIAYALRAELVMANARLVTTDECQSPAIEEAAQLCEHIVQIAHEHNLQEAAYKSYHLLGRISLLRGQMQKASQYYQAAITEIEHILSDLVYDLSPAFLHTAWIVYADMIALCLQQNRGARAFRYLERGRSMALHQYLSGTRQHGSPSAPPPARQMEFVRIQAELENWQERYRKYSTLLTHFDASVSTAINRETIQAEFERCESKVSELFERLSLYQEKARLPAGMAKGKRPLPRREFVSARLRKRLAEKQTLLAYFLHRGTLVIFALNARKLAWREIPDGVKQLESLLPFLHAHLQSARWTEFAAFQKGIRAVLRDLHRLLIAPVQAMLPKSPGLLTIVPYGPLHSLPFHALFSGSRFLIEDFSIHYLPASSLLPPSPVPEQNDSAKGSGSPLFFGYSDEGQLRYVPEEVRRLSTMLQGKCYLEEDATIARLTQEAPGSPIIHVATHGQNRVDAPNFSSVLLADGKLNAIDVFNLNLRDCELVTLSGCETGLSMSMGGDEQLGLGRAFLAAGAEALVMSLWPVEDQTTNELMEIFYSALLEDASRVEALRTAQRDFLARADPEHTHPYYWAAF